LLIVVVVALLLLIVLDGVEAVWFKVLFVVFNDEDAGYHGV